jgi:hypothetical protein
MSYSTQLDGKERPGQIDPRWEKVVKESSGESLSGVINEIEIYGIGYYLFGCTLVRPPSHCLPLFPHPHEPEVW